MQASVGAKLIWFVGNNPEQEPAAMCGFCNRTKRNVTHFMNNTAAGWQKFSGEEKDTRSYRIPMRANCK